MGEGDGTVCILVVVVVQEIKCVKTNRSVHKRKIRNFTVYLKKVRNQDIDKLILKS